MRALFTTIRQPLMSCAVICLMPLATAAYGGQTPPAQDPPPATFKAGVELVRLDVRVTGADGRPVEDLRPDEITIIEDGKARPIVLFQHVDEPSDSYMEVASRTIAGEVSTNQGAPRGSLYVLVFDQHHITAGNEQRARKAAETFLRTRIRPGDRVALYALPGPGPQLDFSADVSRAIAELPKVRGSLERSGFGSLGVMRMYEAYEIRRGNQQVLTRVASGLAQQAAGTDVLATVGLPTSAGATGEDRGLFLTLVREDARTIVHKADDEGRRFLLMLSDLMRQLRGIEGRKVIMLMSEGFFVDNLSRELEQVAAAAAHSFSVIYGVDLNRRDVDLRATQVGGGEQFGEIQSRLEPLGSLAAETDGQLLLDASGRMEAVFDQVAAATQDYYIVGFAPDAGALRDKSTYRRVTVKVSRQGARVSTRSGYSLGDQAVTPADRRRAINTALGAPFPQQGLPIQYTTYVMHSGRPGMQRVLVSLAADLPVAAEGHHSAADVVFVVRNATTGAVAASGTDTIPLPTAARTGDTVGVGTYRVQFEVPAGAYLMRAVVREPGGAVGSADRRVVVPSLDTPGVAASDLILGDSSGALPVRATAYRGDGLVGLMELYARSADRLENVAVHIELAPLGGEGISLSAPGEPMEIRETPRGVSRGVRFALPIENIPPGHYVVRARVTGAGEAADHYEREVRILEGRAPATSASAAPRVHPRGMLDGEIVAGYLSSIRREAPAGTPLARAAELAAGRSWDQVPAALGPLPDPAPAAPVVLAALSLFAAEDYAAAAVQLERARKADPGSALVAFFLGWAYQGARQDRLAIGAWRNAALLDPTLVPAHLALADAYLHLSERALAEQALRAGLSALPGSPELLDRLARLDRRRQ